MKKIQTKIDKIRIGVEDHGWSYTRIAKAINTTPQYVSQVVKQKGFKYKAAKL